MIIRRVFYGLTCLAQEWSRLCGSSSIAVQSLATNVIFNLTGGRTVYGRTALVMKMASAPRTSKSQLEWCELAAADCQYPRRRDAISRTSPLPGGQQPRASGREPQEEPVPVFSFWSSNKIVVSLVLAIPCFGPLYRVLSGRVVRQHRISLSQTLWSASNLASRFGIYNFWYISSR